MIYIDDERVDVETYSRDHKTQFGFSYGWYRCGRQIRIRTVFDDLEKVPGFFPIKIRPWLQKILPDGLELFPHSEPAMYTNHGCVLIVAEIDGWVSELQI